MLDKTISKVLFIDLTRRSFWIEKREELFEKYLGGAGVAIHLLSEECPRGSKPLERENVIVFAVGPLVNMFPMASKTVAMFKSPLTGTLGESHAGGRSAVAIRSAGYGAIVIRGASIKPVYIAIHGDKVNFRDAATYWGMRSTHGVGRIIRENEGGSGVRTIMRIGGAGERLVSYATVVTETYRHFGRLGLGAVFGSKKLKALVVSGKKTFPVVNKTEYRKLYKEIYDKEVKSPLLSKYHELGTASNILVLNELGGLPTKNLKSTNFEGSEEISGELLAEKFLGRRTACAHCPVACIHLATLREPYEDEPYFYKTTWVSYDYEPLYSLGSMLGISTTQGVLKLINEVELLGLDAMSTGVVLAWATEAMEKGLISTKETLDITFSWGDHKAYLKGIWNIMVQPNEFYAHLAKGVEAAALKYGGLDFALAFGGNEVPGYHTGPAAIINHLTGARHSHLDSGGYSMDQKALKKKAEMQFTPEKIAENLFEEEAWRQILSSLVVCFFARGVYTADVVLNALKTVGYNFTETELKDMGSEVLKLKQKFKLREGFKPENLRIPKRALETTTPHGQIDEEMISEAVKTYFKKVQE
ncbi:MAG: aldehyde ferredoxin oxidoreductase family protein [Candidatus Wukongarchaeota archaeon]|nr:aldehyde ferredoxin oxidoreductase family protein [Candidatus Wukongarchaeota archaeon]